MAYTYRDRKIVYTKTIPKKTIEARVEEVELTYGQIQMRLKSAKTDLGNAEKAVKDANDRIALYTEMKNKYNELKPADES